MEAVLKVRTFNGRAVLLAAFFVWLPFAVPKVVTHLDRTPTQSANRHKSCQPHIEKIKYGAEMPIIPTTEGGEAKSESLTRLEFALSSAQKKLNESNTKYLLFAKLAAFSAAAAALFGIFGFVSNTRIVQFSNTVSDLESKISTEKDRALEKYKSDSNKLIAKSQRETAIARQETAELNRRNLDLEQRISPRRLSVEETDKIVASLAGIEGRKIRVVSYAQDVEAEGLAWQIANALSTKLFVTKLHVMTFGAVAFGIEVGGSDVALVNRLKDILASVGYTASDPKEPVPEGFTTEPITGVGAIIFIAMKPIPN